MELCKFLLNNILIMMVNIIQWEKISNQKRFTINCKNVSFTSRKRKYAISSLDTIKNQLKYFIRNQIKSYYEIISCKREIYAM